MRGGGGQKMSVFVHAQGIKTVNAGAGGGQKMAKFCPRSCGMPPYVSIILNARKTGHFLDPPTQSFCWRNIWMVPYWNFIRSSCVYPFICQLQKRFYKYQYVVWTKQSVSESIIILKLGHSCDVHLMLGLKHYKIKFDPSSEISWFELFNIIRRCGPKSPYKGSSP